MSTTPVVHSSSSNNNGADVDFNGSQGVRRSGRCQRRCVDMCGTHGLVVLLCSGGLLVTATLQVVSFKRAGYALGPYPLFILLAVSGAFVPLLFLAVGAIVAATGGFVPESTTFAVKRKFFMIGFFNAANGVLTIFAVPYVSGVLQALLAQAVIPATVVLSLVYLRMKFTAWQYAGALTIIVGVVVELVPAFTSSSGTSSTQGTVPGWAVAFALAQVPQAMGFVYQEKSFAELKVNVIYMMAWAALAQFCCLALATPLDFIPGFGHSTPSEFVTHMGDALRCVANQLPGSPQCSSAAPDLAMCIGSMLAAMVFQTLLVKYSSAMVWVVTLTLVTPVSAVAFTAPFLMGSDAEAIDPLDWAALVILMVGMVVYRYGDMRAIRERDALATKEGGVSTADAGSQQGTGTETAAPRPLATPPIRIPTKDATKHTALLPVQALEVRGPSTDMPHGGGGGRGARAPPVLLASRVGIIASEYTGGGAGATAHHHHHYHHLQHQAASAPHDAGLAALDHLSASTAGSLVEQFVHPVKQIVTESTLAAKT